LINLYFNGLLYKFPRIIKDRFEVRDKVDDGGFGSVYAVKDQYTGKSLVIKIVRSGNSTF
jgi:hypothetical protein